MKQRRVYTGAQATVFLTGGVGEVDPGGEFEVPEEHVAAFDARPDVSVVPARRGGKKTTSGAGGESDSAASGDGD